MQELKSSSVYFDSITHSYLLGKKYLSGITGILSKYLFPNKYDGIPEAILNAAAERGSLVHSLISGQINGWGINYPDDCGQSVKDDVESFMAFAKGCVFHFDYSEFIVSDDKAFASAIDIIATDTTTGEVVLMDIKTTSKLDKEYVAWQLSIYKYLLKLQTGVEAKRLYALHVRDGKCRLIEVREIAESSVIALLECAERGDEYFVNPEEALSLEDQESKEAVAKLASLEAYIVSIEEQTKRYKEERDQLKDTLLRKMTENGIDKIETERLTISVKASYTRQSVDSAKLKKDYPEAYTSCLKESTIKESLTIKLKDIDNESI